MNYKGNFSLIDMEHTEEQTQIEAPQKMTLEEYLGRRGLAAAVDDYMLDKLRLPHGETKRQRDARIKAGEKATKEYYAKRNAAIEEYHQLLAEGKIVEPSKVEQLLNTAHGHEDNQAVQAARRSLTKRGIDWQTGEPLNGNYDHTSHLSPEVMSQNHQETDDFSDVDPAAIRAALAENRIVDGHVVDPDKLDANPFIQQVMADVEQIAANELPPPERFSVIETEGGYAVWDDIRDEIYVDSGGVQEKFTSEWQAEDYLRQVKKDVADKEAAEWLAVERAKQEPAEKAADTEKSAESLADGRTIPKDFLYKLDPPPKGVRVEDAPQKMEKAERPKESFDKLFAGIEKERISKQAAAPTRTITPQREH